MAIQFAPEPKPVPKEEQEPAAEKLGPGRRPSGNETVTLRVDSRAVRFFKAYGDNWKQKMAEALRKAAGL